VVAGTVVLTFRDTANTRSVQVVDNTKANQATVSRCITIPAVTSYSLVPTAERFFSSSTTRTYPLLVLPLRVA